MTVQNMWPLAFLVVIPIIILLYLLKQRVKDHPFSSTLLWQEIYKNLEAKTPFEKLKQNILMYLQILLMLLLIFALMAPVLKKGGALQENTVIVIDNSASMQYLYDGDESRLDYSIRQAEQEIDGLSENSTVTLIACSSEATVLYQGKDKSTLKHRLKTIEETLETGNLDVASNVVNSLVADMPNVQIICYTDTNFASEQLTKSNEKAALIVENVYSEGVNCSMDYVNYTVTEANDTALSANATDTDSHTMNNNVEVLAKVTNYGNEEVTQDISLYVNSEIVDVQSVTIPAGDSETVYFADQNMLTDGSVVIKAELSGKDSLTADNSQSTTVIGNLNQTVLLLSEGNVFLEKALSLSDNVEVYKSDDVNVLNQAVGTDGEAFDLYVFDGISLSPDFDVTKLPKDASYLFLNYGKDFYDMGYIGKDTEISNTTLSFEKSTITEYVENYVFGITKAYTYTLPEWGIPFLKDSEGSVVGYYGTVEQHNIAVLGFDIHNTDLALQTEFPIFMSQLSDWLLGTATETLQISNFPVAEESAVTPVDSVVVEGSKDNKKTGGRAIRNLLLMLVILLLIMEWIVYTYQVNSTKKKQFLVVRFLVLLAVVLAMAGLSISKKQKQAETIFLVDVSDSMSGNLEEVETYLRQTISEMPEKNLGGVVAFGKDTAVDQFLSDKKIFNEFTTKPVTIATNIEKAINAACSMFDEGVTKRLVLITDGSENEGSMNLAAATLQGRDVELYTIAMDDCIGGNSEVYIDGLEAPNVIHVGDHYNVTVSVRTNVETDAKLSLYAGRTAKGQQSIHLNKGSNQFVFEDIGEEGTIAQYKAVIEPLEDTISVNNTYVTFAEIEARSRILLVEGTPEEASEFEKVLEAANIDYDTVTPKGVPITLSELNQYKAVVTLNAHYDDLRQGFATVLDSYVKDFSGGYVCIGGDNSYALGGYRGTELENMLPVYMDLQGEKEIPKMSMTFVIDQSSSMSSPSEENTSVTGLDLAKQAAISGVSEVRDTDEVGVLAFDDAYSWIVPIQQATDVEKLKDDIRSIAYGGGTSIYPALQEAYLQVLKSDAKLKHIVLLTDGQDGYNQYDKLLRLINDAGITVSTVAVGRDSDQNTLSRIAEQCGGRFYYTDVNNAIPRIFAQEVYLSTKTYLINEEFYPTITSNNEVLEGVMTDGCPALLGYIAATAKPTADVILESDNADPILTTWQYGLGRTVAWNSDGNNQWTAQYATWDNYPMLWSNIIQYVVSDTELGEDNLAVVKEGNTAVISYETKEYDKDTQVEAIITDESGNAKEIVLDAVKPGSFETSVDMEDIGVYNVSIRKKNGEEILKNYNTAYANQYSVEYQFTDTKTDLDTFTKQAGGKEITFQDNIWEAKQEAVKAKISLTVPLLILAMMLFLFDIMIRRFSLDIMFYLQKAMAGASQKWKSAKFTTRKRINKEKENANINDSISMSATESSDGSLKEKATKQATNRCTSAKASKKDKKSEKKLDEQNEKLDMNALLKKKQDRN